MNDTERLNWIESNGVTVHSMTDDAMRVTGWAVHHSLFGWFHSAISVRHAIDNAANGRFAGATAPTVVNPGRQ